jgi:hypothetical protein
MKAQYNADYVDDITTPGSVRLLSKPCLDSDLASIRNGVEISLACHHSRVVAIACHHDCAGNPVSREVQLEELSTALERVRAWNEDIEVIGLWLNENWEVICVK